MSRYLSALQLTGNWVLMLMLAAIAGGGIAHGIADIPVPARQIILAASCTLTGFLLLGLADSRCPLRELSVIRWCVLAAAGCFLLMLPYIFSTALLVNAAYVSLGVFILMLLLCSLLLLAQTLLGDEPRAALLVTLLASACSTAPLWLGPLAELAGSNQQLVDAIVAISPLSYLALLADYDYLRSAWFYQHTPFGGLRYNYPSTISLTSAYLTLTALLLAARWQLQWKGRQVPGHLHDYSA